MVGGRDNCGCGPCLPDLATLAAQKERSPASPFNPTARASQTKACRCFGTDWTTQAILHPGLRHDPVVPRRTVRLPRTGTDHRRIPVRIARYQFTDSGPATKPGGVSQSLRPGEIRPV